MSEEYKLSYFKSFKMYNRLTYALFILFCLLTRGSEITKSNIFMLYYCVLFLFMLAADEYVFKNKHNKFPYLLLNIVGLLHYPIS